MGPRRLPKRRLFITKDFAEWAKQLDTAPRPHALLSHAGELDAIAAEFVAGERIVSFIRRIDPPTGQGLLRINTSSLRLAGWCPEPQAMILAAGAKADDTHGPGKKMAALGKLVIQIRREMGVTTWARGEFYELFRFES